MNIELEISQIRSDFLEEIQKAVQTKGVEDLKVKYLGKKGLVSSLMFKLKDATKEEKPLFGKLINDLKQEISSHLDNTQKRLFLEEMNKKLKEEDIDITLPGRKKFLGKMHPVIQMMNKMIDIFSNMGFSVQYGPDIESDYYNFEALNFEKDHPARDMQDTYYLSSHYLMRTHTSNVQVRVMENAKPPLRVIAPGRCFRNETISSRSHVFFHQIELFYIDKNVSMADLISLLKNFWTQVFEQEVDIRVRPSYFPFVEPGMECDISCVLCKGKGCRICKHTGWLEVLGAGMIHPNVLKAGGIDPEKYTGYAAGIGIERTALLYYNLNDIRLFTENDQRILSQF